MSAKPRKPRTLKNGIIDISQVTIEAGQNYINWINTTKEKLKEREGKLLMIRIKEIESIINLHQFIHTKYTISKDLIRKVLNVEMYQLINTWKGINFRRIKKPINSFRDYFVIGKNWWDINKQSIISSSFWIGIFHDLQQKLNLDENNVNYFHIILALFDGSIKFPNTRKQSLINCSILLNNKATQQYLFKLHSSLNIEQWIISDKLEHDHNNKRYEPIGKKVLNQLKQTLNDIISNWNSNQLSQSSQSSNQTELNQDDDVPTVSLPQILPPPICPILDTSPYGATHGPSNHVSDVRYNPTISVFTPPHYNNNNNNNINNNQISLSYTIWNGHMVVFVPLSPLSYYS